MQIPENLYGQAVRQTLICEKLKKFMKKQWISIRSAAVKREKQGRLIYRYEIQ